MVYLPTLPTVVMLNPVDRFSEPFEPVDPVSTPFSLCIFLYGVIPFMLLVCACMICRLPWFPRLSRVKEEDIYSGYASV